MKPNASRELAYVFILLSVILLTGCAPQLQRASIPTLWQPSPNFGDRRPNFVIIHHTGDSAVEQSLNTLTNPREELSAHYLISRDGMVYQLVDERARAWHAGDSRWGANTDLNSSSLGIELDNNGNEPFPDIQIIVLLTLLDDIKRRYHIPTENFLGHADIAPRRKSDPNRYFPWERLAQSGFGRWCYPPLPEMPPSFDPSLALRTLGYDISDIGTAVRAFKLHFAPGNITTSLSTPEQNLLYCLVRLDLSPPPEKTGKYQ
ncbi:MAG: N-acetylmuramoyl-L-alanine amidase [Pseudomonadota bacterium]